MDILYFLTARTSFIRGHYDVAAGAFEAIKHQIENEEAPFDNPPYSEDGEPAFLEEWMDANTSIQLVGLACTSLLNDALKLYLNLMQHRQIRFVFDEEEAKRLKKEYVGAYRDALGEIFDTDWSDAGVDFAVIEQVVLARNRGQHGTDLTSFHLTHDKRTLDRHSRPHFAEEREVEAWIEAGGSPDNVFLAPAITVTREALLQPLPKSNALRSG